MRDQLQDIRRAMHRRLTRVARDETGATAVEYAVMVGLIAAVIIFVVQALGIETVNAFQSVLDALP
jgi:pilus assembly protein Flp/PilA